MQNLTQLLLNQIYARAKLRGLTQSELCQQVGLNPSALSRAYRRGVISLASLEALATAVGLSIRLTEIQSELAAKLKSGTLF